MRIIDAHVHLLDEAGYAENLLRAMDACGIERACVSTLGETFGLASEGELRKAMAAYRDRIVGAAFVRPGVDGPERIDRAVLQGFRMLKVSCPRVPYDDPSCFELWAKAVEHRLPVLFHTGLLALPKMPPPERIGSWWMHPIRLDAAASAFPELKIIVAHLGVSWNLEAADLARMRKNVYVDLTGEVDGWRVRADREGMNKFLWWPGAFEKVVFGTDVHYSRMRDILREDTVRLDRLGVDRATREMIFSENILSLLGERASS